jgi:hypothetical protein
MGPDRLVDPGAARHPAHDAAGTVAVHALAVGGNEDRAGEEAGQGQSLRGECVQAHIFEASTVMRF